MLRDHLEIDESDTLERVEEILLKNRGREEITRWSIKGPDGHLKGRVTLFDKFCSRRSGQLTTASPSTTATVRLLSIS